MNGTPDHPDQGDVTWRRLCPGIYHDRQGALHFVAREILIFLREAHPESGFDPENERDHELLVSRIVKLVRRECPHCEISVSRFDISVNRLMKKT